MMMRNMTKGFCDICEKIKSNVIEFRTDYYVVSICNDCLKGEKEC